MLHLEHTFGQMANFTGAYLKKITKWSRQLTGAYISFPEHTILTVTYNIF